MATVTERAHRADFDLSDLRAIGPELEENLARVRAADRIFWSEIQQGWFVTHYDDVSDAFMNKNGLPLLNDRLGTVAFASIPQEEWATRIPLLTSATPTFANMTDPPYHAKLRKPMNAAFSQKNINHVKPDLARRLEQLLDDTEKKGTVEFIDDIARPLTGTTIMSLMGVPQEHLANLRDWANGIVYALGTPRPSPELLEGGEQAMREMDALFTAELEKRRANPTDDFLSIMAKAMEGEGGLTHAEMLGTCVNTLLAGHESTASTMAFGTVALAEHPDQVAWMLANPDRMAGVLDEVQRYVGMSASQTRVAGEDFEWHGSRIRKGDAVYLWVSAASRDPAFYADPDRFDLSRPMGQALVFGKGIHHCVGHLLAKLQLGAFFPAFFGRFDVEILDDPLDYSGGYAFRTLSTMNCRVTRKAG